MWKMMDLAYLNARTRLALSVADVLESGEQAMQDGGAFAEQSKKIDQLGGGVYHLVYKGVIFIALTCIAIGCGRLAWSNSQDRIDAKKSIFWAAVAGAIVASAGAILVFASEIGSGIFTDLGGN